MSTTCKFTVVHKTQRERESSYCCWQLNMTSSVQTLRQRRY